MKTYAPRSLRGSMLADLIGEMHGTVEEVAKYLEVAERTVRRWLADGTAPRAVLAALWHETPTGRYESALDVGNELAIVRGLARNHEDAARAQAAQLARVLAIADTGAANDPIQAFDAPLTWLAPAPPARAQAAPPKPAPAAPPDLPADLAQA